MSQSLSSQALSNNQVNQSSISSYRSQSSLLQQVYQIKAAYQIPKHTQRLSIHQLHKRRTPTISRNQSSYYSYLLDYKTKPHSKVIGYELIHRSTCLSASHHTSAAAPSHPQQGPVQHMHFPHNSMALNSLISLPLQNLTSEGYHDGKPLLPLPHLLHLGPIRLFPRLPHPYAYPSNNDIL